MKIPPAPRLRCGGFQYFLIKPKTAIHLLKSPQSPSIGLVCFRLPKTKLKINELLLEMNMSELFSQPGLTVNVCEWEGNEKQYGCSARLTQTNKGS